MEYPKINSVYMRDGRGRFTTDYACPEFGYLADTPWVWFEKVDGTNIRVTPDTYHSAGYGGQVVNDPDHTWVKGRTDNAQLPPKLLDAVLELFNTAALGEWVHKHTVTDVTFYGEGYGAGIQKGGMYRPDPSFVLFDVKIGGWWLRRADVEDIAGTLGLDVVPQVATMPLAKAVEWMRDMATGELPVFESQWPGARPEGIVGRPVVDLWDRKGTRITTKIKFRDFPQSPR